MAAMSPPVADDLVPLSWATMGIGRGLRTLDASLQTVAPDVKFMTLVRSLDRDKMGCLNSLEGRRKAMNTALRQAGSAAMDGQLLTGTGLRIRPCVVSASLE